MSTQRIYTPDEAVERLGSLAPEMRKFLYSKEMRNILMTIGEKHKLHLDQLSTLEAETNAVFLGFTETQDYPRILAETLKIDEAKIKEIAKDVNEMLFIKVREDMKAASSPVDLKIELSKPTAVAAAPTPAPAAIAPSLVPKPVMLPAPGMAAPTGLPDAASPAPTVQPAPIAVPQAPATPPPVKPVDVAAETILTQKTVSTPPAGDAPTNPVPYKADPYREPPE